MSDPFKTPQVGNAAPGPAPATPNMVAMAMLNASLTAQIGMIIGAQMPATDVMNVLCEHIGQLLALIEPEQLRNSILGEIRRNLPGVMNRHLEARLTTAGGIRLPEGMTRQ